MGILIILISVLVFILILKSDINSDDIDSTVPQDPNE